MPFTADVARTIDPQGEPEFRLNRGEGLVTQRDLADALDLLQRSIIKREPTYVTYAIGPWFRENIGASGDADYTTRQIVPTGATTFGSETRSIFASRAGRIMGGHLIPSETRTAGTATLAVLVTYADASTETILLPDCVIDGTNSAGGHHLLPNNQGIAFPAGSFLRPMIRTVSWTPTTCDMAAYLVLSFQDV